MTVPYPPPAHLAELAGLIALACVAALWRLLPRRRIAATAGALSLALAAWSCWVQAPPVPERTLAAIVTQATQPARYERCTVRRGVRYCYYPAFASLVTRWAAPVDGVLARIPAPGTRRLTVRQVVSDSFLEYPLVPVASLTSNGPSLSTSATGSVAKFQDGLQTNPRLIPGTSGAPVYTGLAWPRGGSSLGADEFGLALSTAFWVTGLPTTAPEVTMHGPDSSSGTAFVPCLAVSQAREAIALWLAASATPAARAAMPAAFFDGAAQVGKRWVGTEETGWDPASLTVTAQGVALASAMLRLPGRQVESVLSARWPGWLSPQATDAQLASALGIPLPSVPAPADPQHGLGDLVPPPSPVCR
jgi:hypothetical protein